MNEHEILVKIASFKHLHIPEGAFVWSWFKRYYLEDQERRKLLSNQPALDFQSFKKTIKATTRPTKYFPTFVRNNKRKIRDWIHEFYVYYNYTLAADVPFDIQDSTYGLGIVSRNPAATSKDLLWGIIYYVSDETAETLIEMKYPSLYGKGLDTAIVCGPISLLNHSCGSPFGFSLPTKKYPNEELEVFFGGCDMILIKNFDRRFLQAGQEITVKYCKKRDLKFECRCYWCLKCVESDCNN